MPHWPCWANLNIDGATGNRAWPLVIVVIRWPHADAVGQVLVEELGELRLVVPQVDLRQARRSCADRSALRPWAAKCGKPGQRRVDARSAAGAPSAAAARGRPSACQRERRRGAGRSCRRTGGGSAAIWMFENRMHGVRTGSRSCGCQFRFNVSSRFRIRLATSVQAASSRPAATLARRSTRRRGSSFLRGLGIRLIAGQLLRERCLHDGESRRRSGGAPARCGRAKAMRSSGVAAAFGEQPLGQGAGRFEVLHVVHQLQRLQRRVAALAARCRLLAVGGVEVRHERRRRGALEEHVEAAAIQRRAVVLHVDRVLLIRRSRPAPRCSAADRASRPGRPSRRLSRPLTNSALSRTCSASSRNRGPRA